MMKEEAPHFQGEWGLSGKEKPLSAIGNGGGRECHLRLGGGQKERRNVSTLEVPLKTPLLGGKPSEELKTVEDQKDGRTSM